MKPCSRRFASLSNEQRERLAQGPSLGDFISEDLKATDTGSDGYDGKLVKEKGMKR